MTITRDQHFRPIRVLDIEIGSGLPDIPSVDPENGVRYERALSLVRLHTQPIGKVELSLGYRGLSAIELGNEIWHMLQIEINEHLRRDDLPEVTGLKPEGIPGPNTPRCLEARAAVLASGPRVTVVVPTRDRTQSLDACLRSLLSLDYPDYEVVVIDNAPSTRATADLVQQRYRSYSRIHYAREDRPGTSWARNRGLAEAGGEIVAFTDDDVIADRWWLAALVAAFSVAEDVGCVTGMTPPLELETQVQAWFEQCGPFSRRGFSRRIFDLKENRPRTPLYPYSAGIFGRSNNTAFRRDVLTSIGGFDPAMGPGTPAPGCEDLAVHVQVILRAYKLVYEPAAIVRHVHRRDQAGLHKQIYGSGVGLTAYLTKCLAENPGLLFEFAAMAPYGLFYGLSSRSPKNTGKQADFPKELTFLERRGWLHGPIAYLRGRHQVRKVKEQFGAIVLDATDRGRQS